MSIARRIAYDAARSRRARRLLLACLAVALVGCGSSAATTHNAASASLAKSSALSGSPTGSAPAATSTATPVSATAPPNASCATAVAATLGTVAARVYHEAATGGDVAEAVHRVQSSTALADAIDSDDAAAARAALQTLLLDQIARVEVIHDGHVFAQAGSGAAIAPVHGSIPGTSATYILSTQPTHAYLQVVHQVTGAQVLLLGGAPAAAPTGTAPGRRLAGTISGSLPASAPAAGSLTLAETDYQAFTLAGAVYPAGALQIVLLVPTSAISCPGPLAQARIETLGHVGERIYQEELHSPDVAATLRSMEGSTAFQRAVAARGVSATRAAILGFFAAHIHVVRVRVTVGGRLLIDEGGPYALAPVHGTLRSGGHVVGDFEMAIQDDAGYLKLAHLFTGAEVLMRTGSRQVMGTLSPGPASVPDRGEVAYRGRTYQAYSFVGEAFPTGPLRISLLL